ncbi:MAG: tryptophan--tRNA ligase [Candidatus Niyogibacteria bacterium]|nr:MAG: tryptophan--tRNA ligase [Candidatus Niyogibacteria bacterium]
MAKEIVLSGMRPTGELHLGNYFGALRQWVNAQNRGYKCFWMVADLHSLTTLEDTKSVRKNTYEMAATWIASGLDPKKSVIFLQSAVPEHGELASIFSTLLPVSMLELNPTYKEMTAEHPKSGSFGILNYPVLQAADILIYKATAVPIGKDQNAHIEIAREVARRFNHRFGKIFPEPQALFGALPKIFSLKFPDKKMSKSHGSDSYIALLDSPDKIREKIKSAVTDSGSDIKYDGAKKPAISNLLAIYELISGVSIKKLETKYKKSGYSEFKKDLAEAVIAHLSPIQKKYALLSKNPKAIDKILKDGSKAARIFAQKTMEEVKQKIGLLDFY